MKVNLLVQDDSGIRPIQIGTITDTNVTIEVPALFGQRPIAVSNEDEAKGNAIIVNPTPPSYSAEAWLYFESEASDPSTSFGIHLLPHITTNGNDPSNIISLYYGHYVIGRI